MEIPVNPPANRLPTALRVGSIMVFLGGLVPFLVSTVLFVAFLWSDAHPDQPWLSGQVLPHAASYSLNDIRRFNPDVAVAFMTAQHIELVNVMNSGVLVALLAIFGLRRYQRWSWYALLFTALWPGLNDAWAVLAAREPPAPLVGGLVTLVGLFLSRGAIFGASPRGSS